MSVIELPGSSKPARTPRIARRVGAVVVADYALELVIQSVVGVVRESAGLLYHVAGFGVALVSGPNISRPRSALRPTRLPARESANVIPFPQRQTSGYRPRVKRNQT
jgi:hypothetical protein